MEIDKDVPEYGSDRQNYNSSSKPVMSQEAVQQGYSNTKIPAGNYDAFFKEKIKSYRPHIIITALLQLGLFFLWPFIAIMSITIIFGEDVLSMPTLLVPQEVLTYIEFLDIFTTIISILLIIGLIYFTVQDAKKNTGQNPTSAAVLVFILGFLGALIYILTTLRKQGKAAKKQVQQSPPNPQNPTKP